MKKKEKYYPENRQEDEDGYTLYPENAMNFEMVKKDGESSPGNNTEHSRYVPANLRSRSFSNSPAANAD
jgi:hypothetical protein